MNMRKAILVAAAAVFFGGGIASARDQLEVADLQCVSGITFSPTQLNQPITFALLAGVQGPGIVGTAISVSGSQFTSIVLQPGIYRISWEIDEGPILPGQTVAGGWFGLNAGTGSGPTGYLQPTLNGDPQIWTPPEIVPAIPHMERLIVVTAPNSVLQILANPTSQGDGGGSVTTGVCQLIILQLQ
jgi:hypothetical protein